MPRPPAIDRDPDGNTYLSFSRAKLSIGVLGSLFFVALGAAFMLVNEQGSFRWWMGLAGAVLFGALLLPPAILALFKERRLGIGKSGIWVENRVSGEWQRGELLAWNGIYGAEIAQPGQHAKLWRGTKKVVLRISESIDSQVRDLRGRTFEPMDATHGGRRVTALPTTLAAKREEVLAVVREYHDRYGRS